MKYSIVILALPVVLLSCGQNDKSGKEEPGKTATEIVADKKADSPPAEAIFSIKAAKIVFNCTAGPETGTETLYFDDFGAVAVLITNKKSKYSVTNQTSIWKDKKTTIIDHTKKTVVKSSWRPKATEPPSLADTDVQSRKYIGYERLADEIVAGKSCEVWFNAKQNFKYCLWKKIALKELLETSFSKEATAVEEISEIPPAVVEIPKDYKQ